MIIRESAEFRRAFKRLRKKYPSISKDLALLLAELGVNPFLGEQLGHNCYKVRMAITAKGKGKSGGARVITCVKIVDDVIHLLTIYDKSELENISDAYLEELRKWAE